MSALSAAASRGVDRSEAQSEAPPYDRVLLWAVLGLTMLGLVMVFSASAVAAAERLGDPLHYVKRQSIAAVLGIFAMLFAMRLGHRRLEALAYPILAVSLVTLVLVAIPGIGTVAGGARRWIRFAGFSFQPGELAKLSLVLYLARSLARKREKILDFSIGFVPHTVVAGTFALLALLEPDFGTAMTLLLLNFTMLFCAGAKLSWLASSFLAGAPAAVYLVVSSEYRMKRILAFLDPWADARGIGYQIAESLMSIGSGGLFGLGLGGGKQKLFYLPEAHTDFIAAVIGEELGLAGILLVIALFATVIWRGLRAAYRAQDAFGAHLATGITALFGVQAVGNLAVVMGLVPTKGLALPFLSYGGTSMVLSLGAAGILLAISAGKGGYLRPSTR